MEKFDLIPGFKAGIHCGTVTVGEVGVIKKEIVFTGDVLNTTARIEELCNTYTVKLLVSKNLLDMIKIDDHYVKKPIAETTLRGKKTKSILYNLEQTQVS
jgi:adenylate cyclase